MGPGDRFLKASVANFVDKCPSAVSEGPTRHEIEGVLQVGTFFAQQLGEPHAGDLGHHQITQDEVEMLVTANVVEGFSSRLCGEDVVPAKDLAERPEQDRFVVDEQDRGSKWRWPGGRGSLARGGAPSPLCCPWESDSGQRASVGRTRVEIDGATEFMNDSLAYEQTQARALPKRFRGEEGVEHSSANIVFDALARVLDLESAFVVFELAAESNDVFVGMAGFDGLGSVGQEVDENLFKAFVDLFGHGLIFANQSSAVAYLRGR